MSSNTRTEPSRYKIDFSSLMVYSSTSDELSFGEGKWTQSTSCFELLSRRTRNVPATSWCRILAASARPSPSCSHTGHVLMSFSRTLMPRRGRQFFGAAGGQGGPPSSSSSSSPSPLPTSGRGPAGSPRAGAPASRIMPPAARERRSEGLRRRAARAAVAWAPAWPWRWPSGRARAGAAASPAPGGEPLRSERPLPSTSCIGARGLSGRGWPWWSRGFCRKPGGGGS